MLDATQASLLSIFGVVRWSVTRPGFTKFVILALGWIRCQGVRAVTEALVVTGISELRHHEAFTRFFSSGTWDPDCMGHALFERMRRHFGPNGRVRVVIDDTLAKKTGAHVFGIASHLDAVQSTRKRRVFSFGHCWVVLAVIVPVPFSKRPWALPVLFRLYRREEECHKNGGDFLKKTELARQLVDKILEWDPGRIELAADSAYCNATVLKGLPERVAVFGSMRTDAVLTALPVRAATPKAGRPAKRGNRLPSPAKFWEDREQTFRSCSVFVYRKDQNFRYKTFDAQWYVVTGERLLRIAIVETKGGSTPYRVLFTTDPTLDVPEVIAGYGSRWSP